MKIPRKVIYYISVVTLTAIALVSFIAFHYELPDVSTIVFWMILAAISESLGIVLPSGVGLSVSFATHLACIIIGGPFLSIIVSASSYVFCIMDIRKVHFYILKMPFYKSVFNISEFVISSGIASLVYLYTGGSIGEFLLIPTILCILAYTFVNTLLLSKLMSLLHNNRNMISSWIHIFRGLFLNMFAIGMIGVILALAYMSYGPGAVILFFGPLLLARFSFKLYINMRNTYMETIHAFNKFLEAKDTYTSGHASRVQKYAEMIASAAHMPEEKIESIRTAALLHDIGKIGISDNILKKPFSLSFDEYEEIKKHTVIGAEILEGVDFLKDISTIIKQHHERYDGSGYPMGLKKDEIRQEASILAIADVFDAMTSERPYRKAMSKDDAIAELKRNAGTQLHPELTRYFLDALEQELQKENEANPC